MSLTTKDIAEFRALYRKHYGVDLSDADAYDCASRLMRLFKILYMTHKSSEINPNAYTPESRTKTSDASKKS